tara:strand:- start:315 stop:1034 length:720 start_codon:yes stop_codon:yes gene_type:complete
MEAREEGEIALLPGNPKEPKEPNEPNACEDEANVTRNVLAITPEQQAVASFLAECFTLVLTTWYTALQLDYGTDHAPRRYAATNGFCLPSIHTHLWCGYFDICIWMVYVLLMLTRPVSSPSNWLTMLALTAHVYGHLYLYQCTWFMDIRTANAYKHWSFTIVLVVVNTLYCLPRIMLYPPHDVANRAKPKQLFTSYGVMYLMILAFGERIACPCLLRYVGGHVAYDLGIATLVLGREIL